jgi:precorrin-6B methylase 2
MAAEKILSRAKNKYAHLRHHVKNAGLKTFVVTKIYDHYIGLKLKAAGVSHYTSSAPITASALKDAHENQPSYFYSLRLGFKAVPFSHSDINLLDIGCGNGKVLNYAMLQQFRSVTGIELEASALEKAITNCNKLKAKGYSTPFEIINADAVEYVIPEQINVIYMFNPFGAGTMQKVAINIVTHAKKAGRAIYLVYCMPSFQSVFEAIPEAEKIYEMCNKDGTQKELSVFKILPGL